MTVDWSDHKVEDQTCLRYVKDVKRFECLVIIWKCSTTDNQIFDYHTSEALCVSDVPLPVGRILQIWGNATEVEWVWHLKSFSVTFIDDGLWHAAIDSHGEVFTHHQKLNGMEFSIIYSFIAKMKITFYILGKVKLCLHLPTPSPCPSRFIIVLIVTGLFDWQSGCITHSACHHWHW